MQSFKASLARAAACAAVTCVLAWSAQAQTIGVTVGAGQSVTNSASVSADLGVLFQGNGGTLTNDSIIQGRFIMGGPDFSTYNIPYSNITINNSGTLRQDALCNSPLAGLGCGGGISFLNSAGTATNIAINNSATGVIQALETLPNSDSTPIELLQGVSGATITNAGLITSTGLSTESNAIQVGGGAANVTINNQATGNITNTGTGAGIRLDNEDNLSPSNITISNAGTISGASAQAAIQVAGSHSDAPTPHVIPDTTDITGFSIANTGAIDGSASGVAIDDSANTGSMSVTSSGTIKGNVLFGTGGDTLSLTGGTVNGNVVGQNAAAEQVAFAGGVNTVAMNGALINLAAATIVSGTTNFASAASSVGTYTQTGGTAILHGGTFAASGGFAVSGGVFGGTGTLVGNVNVSGSGTLHVGASPDPLAITGNFTQTGGDIAFEVDPNGSGGFLESSLVFDPGATLDITNTDIVFNFLNGADPLAFFGTGAFDLGTFFTGTGDTPSELAALFANDTFTVGESDYLVSNFSFDPSTGAANSFTETPQANVPEPASLALLGSALAGLGLLRRRKRKSA